MMRPFGLAPVAFRLSVVLVFVVRLATGAPFIGTNIGDRGTGKETSVTANPSPPAVATWNVTEKELPLLSLQGDRLESGLARSLAFRLEQFAFLILKPLTYDEKRSRYLLPSFTAQGAANQFIEFAATDVKNTYQSTAASNIRLIDNDTTKTIRTSDGATYLFDRYSDNEFRCALLKDASGASLNLLYTANGLVHAVVDAGGRTVKFNYDADGISSVTQTWRANAKPLTKTWSIDGSSKSFELQIKYSHVVTLKKLPPNALVHQFTAEMAASDKLLAHIFGGPNAVAAGNGFEPDGLAAAYPLYRGDIMGDDGVERRGHLSYAMHIYGSADGTGDSPLYVPAGFTAHSAQPSPTDGAVTFYYPKLGNLSNVTLAVFHVADFQISDEGARVRIGKLGGPGGSSPLYKHSHIEFYRGNTGLPPLSARVELRIDPARVFSLANDGK